MKRREKAAKKPQKPLDSTPAKRARGPGRRIQPSWVVGRAQNYKVILDLVWNQLWPLLANATSEQEVAQAFHEGARPYQRGELLGQAALALRVLQERKFPKTRRARINFLADSLGGSGVVSPRRSRDICAEWRAEEKRAQSAHRITRYEYWVECSCRYKGRSQNHACPRCGAKITFDLSPVTDLNPFIG